MEELKSTEELDREIEADARRKAAKIEKDAAASIEKSKTEWKTRLDTELEKEAMRFSARLFAHRAETEARLLLDKQRLAAERTERCLKEAAANFLVEFPCGDLAAAIKGIFNTRVKTAGVNGADAITTNGGINIVLDTPSLRVTASAQDEAAEMLLEKRAELTEALFGKP